jgi:signal transduction histidine kinase
VLERYRKIRQQISLIESKPAPDLAQATGLQRQEQIIRALLDLGRIDQAKKQFTRRLAVSPDHPSNSILQGLIDKQQPR